MDDHNRNAMVRVMRKHPNPKINAALRIYRRVQRDEDVLEAAINKLSQVEQEAFYFRAGVRP